MTARCTSLLHKTLAAALAGLLVGGCSAPQRLAKALQQGDSSNARAIIEGTSTFAGAEQGDQVPLCIAAAQGREQIVASLLEKHADPNALDPDSLSALYFAAREGNQRIIDHLLNGGAKPNLLLGNGWTPLMAAADSGRVAAIERLIAAGARIQSVNRWGADALYMAAVGNRLAAAQLLLKHGAKPNAELTNGWSPLLAAVDGNRTEMASLLVDNGAKVLTARKSAPSMLWVAHANDNPDMMRLLLTHGADVDERVDGKTPLMDAVTQGRAEPARLLLSHGANVNVGDGTSMTPLMLAVAGSHTGIVELLLANGADAAKVNNHGHNAFAVLMASYPARPSIDQVKIAMALLSHGHAVVGKYETPLLKAKTAHLLAVWHAQQGDMPEAGKKCREAASGFSSAATEYALQNEQARRRLRREKVGDFFGDLALAALSGAAQGASAAINHSPPPTTYNPNLPEHNYSTLEGEIAWTAGMSEQCRLMAEECGKRTPLSMPEIMTGKTPSPASDGVAAVNLPRETVIERDTRQGSKEDTASATWVEIVAGENPRIGMETKIILGSGAEFIGTLVETENDRFVLDVSGSRVPFTREAISSIHQSGSPQAAIVPTSPPAILIVAGRSFQGMDGGEIVAAIVEVDGKQTSGLERMELTPGVHRIRVMAQQKGSGQPGANLTVSTSTSYKEVTITANRTYCLAKRAGSDVFDIGENACSP